MTRMLQAHDEKWGNNRAVYAQVNRRRTIDMLGEPLKKSGS